MSHSFPLNSVAHRSMMVVFEGWPVALTTGSTARLRAGAGLGQRQQKKAVRT